MPPLRSQLDALAASVAGLALHVCSRVGGPLVDAFRFVPTRQRRIAGTCVLVVAAWLAFSGHLWFFEKEDEHRFTARAILSGTLKLRSTLSRLQNDEQVFNGAAYTNWGFGVPLLQSPFHAIAMASARLHGFFPDRTIYFVYGCAIIPILWTALDRLLRQGDKPDVQRIEPAVMSWAATWLALNVAIFPLTSTRFVVYEETIAYFVLLQLLSLSLCIFARRSWSYGLVICIGVTSGMGLLVRPTGLLYAGLWGATVALEGRAKKAIAFIASLAPLVAFWLWSNHAKTGSYTGLGFTNSTPSWAYNMPIERFGSRCSDTPIHTLLGAVRLFTGFFLFVSKRSSVSWLQSCHFDFEERAGPLPFFGPLVLLVTGWTFYRLVVRKERRIALYGPYVLVAILFAMFVRRGMGFAWRYAGDFWPAILLAWAQSIDRGSAKLARRFARPAAGGMFLCGAVVFFGLLVRSPPPETIPPGETAAIFDRFDASRRGTDEPLPSRISCGDAFAPIVQNGMGWEKRCDVDTFSNVFLGVPPKRGDRYRLRARTQHMDAPTVRVYVNGTIYAAPRMDDSYETDVNISQAALTSRIVVVTIEWTRDFDPPRGRLLSIELT